MYFLNEVLVQSPGTYLETGAPKTKPRHPTSIQKLQALGLQLPSKKVLLIGFRAMNTFLDGSWSCRERKPT